MVERIDYIRRNDLLDFDNIDDIDTSSIAKDPDSQPFSEPTDAVLDENTPLIKTPINRRHPGDRF